MAHHGRTHLPPAVVVHHKSRHGRGTDKRETIRTKSVRACEACPAIERLSGAGGASVGVYLNRAGTTRARYTYLREERPCLRGSPVKVRPTAEIDRCQGCLCPITVASHGNFYPSAHGSRCSGYIAKRCEKWRWAVLKPTPSETL